MLVIRFVLIVVFVLSFILIFEFFTLFYYLCDFLLILVCYLTIIFCCVYVNIKSKVVLIILSANREYIFLFIFILLRPHYSTTTLTYLDTKNFYKSKLMKLKEGENFVLKHSVLDVPLNSRYCNIIIEWLNSVDFPFHESTSK